MIRGLVRIWDRARVTVRHIVTVRVNKWLGSGKFRVWIGGYGKITVIIVIKVMVIVRETIIAIMPQNLKSNP